MIFLAVTLGFFAENAREVIVGKRRVNEFMKEIVENLKYDTIRIRLNLAGSDVSTKGMDSLRSELIKSIAGNINIIRLYYFAKRYANEFGNEGNFKKNAEIRFLYTRCNEIRNRKCVSGS